MSVSFFISPFDPALWEQGEPDLYPTSALRIDPKEYSREILHRFPYSTEHSSEEWSWSLDDPIGPGASILLHSDRQIVSFSLGTNFLDFILWHRGFVPAEHDLFLFNSSSWDSLLLTQNTTREEVRQFTGLKELRANSPLNGRWEGLLRSDLGQASSREYQCILSLHHYEDEIIGEFVVSHHSPRTGTLSSSIVGKPDPVSGRSIFYLHETRVVDHGSVLNPLFLEPKELLITCMGGDPPHIKGILKALEKSEYSRLGEIEVEWKPYVCS